MNTIKEHDALEFIDSLLTPEEISESNLLKVLAPLGKTLAIVPLEQ